MAPVQLYLSGNSQAASPLSNFRCPFLQPETQNRQNVVPIRWFSPAGGASVPARDMMNCLALFLFLEFFHLEKFSFC